MLSGSISPQRKDWIFKMKTKTSKEKVRKKKELKLDRTCSGGCGTILTLNNAYHQKLASGTVVPAPYCKICEGKRNRIKRLNKKKTPELISRLEELEMERNIIALVLESRELGGDVPETWRG